MQSTMRAERTPRQGVLIMAVEPAPAPAAALESRLVRALHAHLSGRCETLHGSRSADYRRQQLRGQHVITLRDLAELAAAPQREARDAVRALALELLAAVEPAGARGLLRATATYARESSDVQAVVLEAGADGRYTAEERERIALEIHEAHRALLVTAAEAARATA